ncbi:GTPase IMAP family member 8-like [Engraulis encrasicolus]|uniref:GTPase IMAP family member 8-like n=1 Tax=Engraulis encrasicolus TaxID=184585 RepID=UPI002FD2F917
MLRHQTHPYDRLSEIRIVLLGYRRGGKSASGSTILSGQPQVFDDVGRTAECAKSQGTVQGRQVSVVDTPGWCMDASLEDTTEWTKREIMYSVSLCAPGPHCFLLVIALDKPFIYVFLNAIRQHLELFGERVWCYTMVLFTCGDCLEDMTIEQYIESEEEALQWVIEQCGNRYHVLNNKDRSSNDTQVAELLEKIEEMVAENTSQMEGGHYKMERESFSDMLQCKREAEERAEERRMTVQTQRATLRSLMNDQSHHTEMSIVLLGAKLVGKSSTGNTILASETFETGGGTALCSRAQDAVAGRTITVVDTPGWWTNTASLEDSTTLTRREIEFSACLCPPGPLAFLLVVNLNQPFEESCRTAVGQHVELLGDSVCSHSLVVFTYGECLGQAAVELHIEHEGEALQWLVEKCGNRYHVINNIDEDEDEDDSTQVAVTQLLERIEEMMAGNGGRFYKMDRRKQQEITQRRKEQEERAEERMRKVQKRREMLRSQIGEESHLSPLRMVLLGATMSGKSSSANLILGQDAFEAEGGTALCSAAQGTVTAGRQVTVVDTPGWFTTVSLQDSPTLIRRELVFSASLCPPGPHAVLLVVRLGDPVGREVSEAARQHLDLLGEGVWDHTLVLFTCEDSLGDATVEQLMECEGGDLVSLVERCGNQYHVLNIMDNDDDAQVIELLEKVEEMATAHGCYEMDRERIRKVTERRRTDEARAEERRMKTQMQREALRS